MERTKETATHNGVELPFGISGTLFLRWLPDETLFSLASRYHRLSAEVRPERTCRALFGRIRGGLAHDLPDSVDGFVERTKGLLGCEAEAVIRQHTILPFYLPFRSAQNAETAIEALRGPGIGSLKFRLGMLTSRFRAHHPLKACPQCMGVDRQTHYVAYWHLEHQYPGVWICPRHDQLLQESTLKSSGIGRFQWHLPDPYTFVQPIAPTSDDQSKSTLHTLLSRFAVTAISLAHTPKGWHFEPERLVRAHREAMIERGFATLSGRVTSHASESLSAFLRPLANVPELAALALPADKMQAQFAHLRYPARALTHPLRHIGHLLWLYGSWDAFVAAYQKQAELRTGTAGRPASSVRPASKQEDPRKQTFLALVEQKGIAVTTAARQLGVDAKTGQAWAARAGIASARRPKKLQGQLQRRLVAALRRGCDKHVAATRFGVSVETVTTTLRTEVGLHESWKRVRFEERQKTERRTWVVLRKGNPTTSMKTLRWMASATYAWLYRNDRAWLAKQAESVVVAHRGNNAAVSWSARDLVLCAAVRRAAEALVSEMPEMRITLWRLYQRVPAIRPKLRYLDRLPETRAAIEQAIQHQPLPKGSRSLF